MSNIETFHADHTTFHEDFKTQNEIIRRYDEVLAQIYAPTDQPNPNTVQTGAVLHSLNLRLSPAELGFLIQSQQREWKREPGARTAL